MPIRMIDAQAVRRLLPMSDCIALMRGAFLAAADERIVQPIRQGVMPQDGRGMIGVMQGFVPDPAWFGLKVVSIFPQAPGSTHGSHEGLVLLFEGEHGRLVAMLDANEITAIRTGAASAQATDILARPDVRSLAVFGCGEQARAHLAAVTLVRPFEDIMVWGRDFNAAQAFCTAMSAELGRDVRPVASAEEAAGADVLCTTTAAREPILSCDWLKPGQHLNVVGSSVPSTSEIDVRTVARSRVFVDYLPSALALAGDLRRAREAGVIGEDHIVGSVGEVISGKVAGRRDAAEITLFKSLGMIAQDIFAAEAVLDRAISQDVGTILPW